MVPVVDSSALHIERRSPPFPLFAVPHSPVNSPVHDVVCGDEWRHDVENLCAGPSPRVENGSVGCAGERVLSVRGEAVGDDALLALGCGAWMTSDLVSTRAIDRSESQSEELPAARPSRVLPPVSWARPWPVVVFPCLMGLATHQVDPSRQCTCFPKVSIALKIHCSPWSHQVVGRSFRCTAGKAAPPISTTLEIANSLVVHAERGIVAAATAKDLSRPHRVYRFN